MFPISSPVLLIDREKCERNIAEMARRAARFGAEFRPHMKTHQSADVGTWLRNVGVTGITVSSVTMAEYFFRRGWEDITIAFPCNFLESERIDRLARDISLGILISDPAVAREMGRRLSRPVRVYAEVDSGAGRTGVPFAERDRMSVLLEEITASPLLQLKGFYSHPGHSYSAASADEVRAIHEKVYHSILDLRDHFSKEYGPLRICLGDMPSR